jgi:predicted DNA-binding protein (MmcQ/YjbR family)
MRELGASEEEIDALVGKEQIAETDVRANVGEEAKKYGITSIFKVFANGHAKSKMTLRTAKAHATLIEQLQTRYAELENAEEFTPFALVEKAETADDEA